MPIQVSAVLDNNPTKLEVEVRSKVLDLEGGVWAGQGRRNFVPICVCEQCCACLDYPTIVFSTEREPQKCSMFAKGLVDRPCASCSLSCEHCFPSCKTTFTSHGIEESNLDKGEYFSKSADLSIEEQDTKDKRQRRPLVNIQQVRQHRLHSESKKFAHGRQQEEDKSWVRAPPNRTICHIADYSSLPGDSCGAAKHDMRHLNATSRTRFCDLL